MSETTTDVVVHHSLQKVRSIETDNDARDNFLNNNDNSNDSNESRTESKDKNGLNSRVSKDFKGKNNVYCNGRCIAGSETGNFIATWFLINIPSIPYYIIIILILRKHHFISFITLLIASLVAHLLCMGFLLKTHFTDPGIIQRSPDNAPVFGPLNQKDRYCHTCNVIRPIHAKHCRTCDNCVLQFDHHCPWVGTCVALRNIRYFVGFVTFAGLYSFIGMLSLIVILTKYPGFSNINGFGSIGIVVILIYCAIFAFMLLGMSFSYLMMIPAELTLNEKINNNGKRVMTDAERISLNNENNKTKCNILYQVFCQKLPKSQVFQ